MWRLFIHLDQDYLATGARLFKLRRNIISRIEPILLEEGNDPSGNMRTGEVSWEADENVESFLPASAE